MVAPLRSALSRQTDRSVGSSIPASIEITSFGLAEDLDRLRRLKDLGVARVVPMFPPEQSDKVLPIIDRWAKLMQQVNG